MQYVHNLIIFGNKGSSFIILFYTPLLVISQNFTRLPLAECDTMSDELAVLVCALCSSCP